jgi:hypothetical protein
MNGIGMSYRNSQTFPELYLVSDGRDKKFKTSSLSLINSIPIYLFHKYLNKFIYFILSCLIPKINMQETVMFPGVLYEGYTWSLTLRQEHR